MRLTLEALVRHPWREYLPPGRALLFAPEVCQEVEAPA
jgi:hypothetical protein